LEVRRIDGLPVDFVDLIQVIIKLCEASARIAIAESPLDAMIICLSNGCQQIGLEVHDRMLTAGVGNIGVISPM